MLLTLTKNDPPATVYLHDVPRGTKVQIIKKSSGDALDSLIRIGNLEIVIFFEEAKNESPPLQS